MLTSLAIIIFVSCGEEEEAGFSFGGTQPVEQCLNPVEDTWNALTENAQSRGVVLDMPGWTENHECNVIPGGVVAQDLNNDGWEDLVFLNHEGSPWVFRNLTDGQFAPVSIDLPLFDSTRPALSLGAMDFTGDGLPELIQTGMGYLAIAENKGDFTFGDWELIVNESGFPYSCFGSFSAGDLDQDGDLDIVLAGTDLAIEPGIWPGTDYPDLWGAYTLLLENSSVGWQTVRELTPWEGVAGLSVLQILTDFDNDHDLDILSSSDRSDGIYYPPMALWQNHGVVEAELELQDIAPELGIDLPLSGMGLGSNDLNQDGDLDYCISDVANAFTCLLSDGYGGFYEGARSLNLEIDPTLMSDVDEVWTNNDPDIWVAWSAWSIIMQDINNDGSLDVAATGGAPPDYGAVNLSEITLWQPDWLWTGTESGFEYVDVEHPFFDSQGMYGMVSADLDRDGYRELIKAPAQGNPQIWTNPCGRYNWLEINLKGIDNNPEAFGAKIIVEYGDRTDIQEVHGLLTMGQSPSSIHIGLGELQSAKRIEIWWPDGQISTYVDIAANQHVTFKHPSLVAQ